MEEKIKKLLLDKYYEELIDYLNELNNNFKTYNIVDELISNDNKDCIAYFLDNEEILYFLTKDEINKLKSFINVNEINFKLSESYDYYYKLLFNQGFRHWKSNNKEDIIEHTFTRYNKLMNLKLKETSNGILVSSVIYSNYKLSNDEQVLKVVEYLNQFGLNVNKDFSVN